MEIIVATKFPALSPVLIAAQGPCGLGADAIDAFFSPHDAMVARCTLVSLPLVNSSRILTG